MLRQTHTDDTPQGALLTWYDRNARAMPWRDDPTPYHVLLSEFMLQQTRVDTALPYFQRFTQRWPTLEDLARAREEEVLQEWAGLGYYARARRLLACARAAVAAGGLPSTATALKTLPGIGPYTAGAIASIAFGEVTPLVDGNVERVLCRLDAIEDDPRSSSGKAALWARAAELVSKGRPGDFNQALMELGATVCTPRRPSCSTCPLESWCEARARGRQEDLPVLGKRLPPTPIRGVAVVCRADGEVLLGRRPRSGLLAGMWEPLSLWPTELSEEAAVERCLAQASMAPRGARKVGEVRHVFSHRSLRLAVYLAEEPGPMLAADGGEGYYAELRWTSVEAPGVALSTLAKKVLRASAAQESE